MRRQFHEESLAAQLRPPPATGCDQPAPAEAARRDHSRSSVDRATSAFADDPEVRFPRLYLEACSDAVLTMEFVDGVREADLEGSGIDVRQVVQAGMRCVCRMIFSHGFVHADLHAGNLRFFPPGRVVLLDLGLVGRLNDEDRLGVACRHFAYPWAVASPTADRVARELFDSAALDAWRSNRAGAIDPWRLGRTPVLASDGMTFFKAKVKGRLDGEALAYRLLRRGPWGRA